MSDLGILRRGGICGLWRRTHDLGGTDWDLIMALPAAVARHLHDHGTLCTEDDAIASTLRPGLLVTREAIEARMALCRPETTVARLESEGFDLSNERTPMEIHALWASARPKI